MAETNVLYPENLKGLGLSFDEKIFAIAFELEDEIRARGKEEVFKELGMTAEEMTIRVKRCLEGKIGERGCYALGRVLGNLDSSMDDKFFNQFHTLEDAYEWAMKIVCSRMDTGCLGALNFRMALFEGEPKVQLDDKKTSLGLSEGTEQLYQQVQLLMDEVREHDRKRDQALARIEKLMHEIQRREDCPAHFGWKRTESTLKEINLDGRLTQILWPYRSLQVLRDLDIKTVGEAVSFFQCPKLFDEEKEITLMEWFVIVSILCKEGLISPAKYEVFELQDEIGAIELSERANNCLNRAWVDNLEDFVAVFADGAAEGWKTIEHTRNLGRKTYEEIKCKLGEVVIKLDDSLCFPTTKSDITALDFSKKDRVKLREYGLDTIGELLTACRNENRFRGLRYIDKERYEVAMERLARYGII